MAVITSNALTGITTRMADASMSAGSILQVLSSHKSDVWSGTSTSFQDIDGTDQDDAGSVWCVKITPSATSSKILIMYNVSIGSGGHDNIYTTTGLFRGSTQINHGDAGESSQPRGSHDGNNGQYKTTPTAGIYLDSPSSTSELTYKINVLSHSSTNYINRSGNDTNANYIQRVSSNITAMEVAG